MGSATRKVDLYPLVNQQVNSAVDGIAVKILNKQIEDEHQAILFTGCSPKAGTTAITISRAMAFATTKRSVLLIDCDLRKSPEYKKLNERINIGVADYLTDEEIDLKSVVCSTTIEGLDYIPSGNSKDNPTQVLCSNRLKNLVNDSKASYDIVIFDMPSIDVVPDAEVVFKFVDGIALVVALGETRKKQIKSTIRKVKPYSSKYYGMVINKVQSDVYRLSAKNYDYYFTDSMGQQKFKESKAFKKYKKRSKNERG